MPTTEVLVCPLIAGAELGDPSNAAAVVLKEVGDTLNKKEGVQSIHFGVWIEQPSTFQLIVSKYLPVSLSFLSIEEREAEARLYRLGSHRQPQSVRSRGL